MTTQIPDEIDDEEGMFRSDLVLITDIICDESSRRVQSERAEVSFRGRSLI